MALGPETIAKLEAACSGPMSNWVENLRVLNISAHDDDSATDQRLPGPHKDNARQTL